MYNIREYFKKNKKKYKPDRMEMKKDFPLWLKLIDKTMGGISINQVLDRLPDLALTTDSSKRGLGGYWSNGLAFRLIIKGTPLSELHINVLELLANIIRLKELILRMNIKMIALQVLGDNTASIAWLKSVTRESTASKAIA